MKKHMFLCTVIALNHYNLKEYKPQVKVVQVEYYILYSNLMNIIISLQVK
mgnify:CR=1 FL=1